MHLKNWQCNYFFFSYTIVISLSLELYSHPFWLVCTNDLVKDRCIADNIIIHCVLLFIILKRRFHVPAYLFWDIDHKDYKCGLRTSVACLVACCVPLFCSYCCVLLLSLIYYWKDARQYGIFLLERKHFIGSYVNWTGGLCSNSGNLGSNWVVS